MMLTESRQKREGQVLLQGVEWGMLRSFQLGCRGVELASGVSLLVSKHHNHPAERHAPWGRGIFWYARTMCDTVVMIEFYSTAWLQSTVCEKKCFMMSHAGMINALWNVWAFFVCVMRQYSVFITYYRKLYESVIPPHRAFQSTC